MVTFVTGYPSSVAIYCTEMVFARLFLATSGSSVFAMIEAKSNSESGLADSSDFSSLALDSFDMPKMKLIDNRTAAPR